MKLEFEISDKSYQLLQDIHEAGYAEFRDYEYDSYDSLEESERMHMTKERFYSRNFCDSQDLEELHKYGLIESDGMSWNVTFKVSAFGKEFVK